MTGFTPKTRALILQRDGGCFMCGTTTSLNVHHRTARGMGGAKAAWINKASNGITLCGSGVTGCHGRVEAYRAWAESQGLIVRRGVTLPAHVPVTHPQLGELWLTDDGRYVYVEPDPVF